MKKSLQIKVQEDCWGDLWEFGIFEGRRLFLVNPKKMYERKSAAIRAAKAMAKRIGIPYSDEIIKIHGC